MMSADSPEPIEVVYSYAQKDEALRDELERHLGTLKRLNLIRGWHKRDIQAGTDWRQAVDIHLDRAQIILLLISSDFMDSDYCYSVEMQQALEKHKQGKTWVIPILLRPVDVEGTPIASLRALPTDGKPITSWPDKDAAFTNVSKGIREVIQELKAASVTHSPFLAEENESEQHETHLSFAQQEAKSMYRTSNSLNPPISSINLTITTPNGQRYKTEVPDETLVDQLLRDFLSQWQFPLNEPNKPQRYSLHVKDTTFPTLERSNTLHQAGLGTKADLALVPEALYPNDPVSLLIEDDQGTQYTAAVLMSTMVGQLAEDFLHQKLGRGTAVVRWVLSPTNFRPLRLDASLYDQGVSEDALLRIYRDPIPEER